MKTELNKNNRTGAKAEISSPAPACVTRFELATILQVSVRTVDRMIAAEEIRVRRVRGKVVRFLRTDVDDYLGEKRKAETLKSEI